MAGELVAAFDLADADDAVRVYQPRSCAETRLW
jgi:hypothetical protein